MMEDLPSPAAVVPARIPRMSRKMAVALLYLTCFDAFMTCEFGILVKPVFSS